MVKSLVASVLSSLVLHLTVTYLAAAASLGLSGFLPALVDLTPPILVIAVLVGVVAHACNVQGCILLFLAPVASIVGLFTITTYSQLYHTRDEVSASMGIAFGVGTGVILVLLVLGIRRLRSSFKPPGDV